MNLRKTLTFTLILAIVSMPLTLTGCEQKSEPPAGDQPTAEQPTEETPAEHPAGEHPAGEHPE